MKTFLLILYAYSISLLTIAILKSKPALAMLVAIFVGILSALISKEN